MAILSVATPYEDGDTVTSTNLNALVTASTFDSGATDGTTTALSGGAISVKNSGISYAKLATELGGAIRLVGTAYIGGNKNGITRGLNALDIQNLRASTTDVSSGEESTTFGHSNQASGNLSTAIGHGNTASGLNASAQGYQNTASAQNAKAFGNLNDATQTGASAVGQSNSASGTSSSAFGYNNTVSGDQGTVFGHYVKTTIDNTSEFGYWSDATTRASSVRTHPNSQVALTIRDSASAPTDGGATAGSEADGTLGRGMYCIQKNSTAVTLYFNNSGTIQSLSLGTLS